MVTPWLRQSCALPTLPSFLLTCCALHTAVQAGPCVEYAPPPTTGSSSAYPGKLWRVSRSASASWPFTERPCTWDSPSFTVTLGCELPDGMGCVSPTLHPSQPVLQLCMQQVLSTGPPRSCCSGMSSAPIPPQLPGSSELPEAGAGVRSSIPVMDVALAAVPGMELLAGWPPRGQSQVPGIRAWRESPCGPRHGCCLGCHPKAGGSGCFGVLWGEGGGAG